jgi:hypothetical protein
MRWPVTPTLERDSPLGSSGYGRVSVGRSVAVRTEPSPRVDAAGELPDLAMDVAVSQSTNGIRIVGIIVRTVLVAAVFVITLVIATVTVDHAIRHAGYLRTFSNGDYAKSGPPSLRDAVWFLFIGPVLQVIAFSVILVVGSRRWPTLIALLGPATWTMLVFDALFVFGVLALYGVASI